MLPATQSALVSRQGPHLQREMTQKLPESTTPATRNDAEEYETLHLPNKMNREATEHKHDMLHMPGEELWSRTKGHACHAKRRKRAGNATPAMQSALVSRQGPHLLRGMTQKLSESITPATRNYAKESTC